MAGSIAGKRVSVAIYVIGECGGEGARESLRAYACWGSEREVGPEVKSNDWDNGQIFGPLAVRKQRQRHITRDVEPCTCTQTNRSSDCGLERHQHVAALSVLWNEGAYADTRSKLEEELHATSEELEAAHQKSLDEMAKNGTLGTATSQAANTGRVIKDSRVVDWKNGLKAPVFAAKRASKVQGAAFCDFPAMKSQCSRRI